MDSYENKDYLTKQIITYLGNKRQLLKFIEKQVIQISKKLNKEKMITLDLFSGSGIIARLLKKYSKKLFTNDLEDYSKLLNDVFLTNKSDFDIKIYNRNFKKIQKRLKNPLISGIITKNYSPKNDQNIQKNERTFFTNENAKIIDTIRNEINNIKPKKYQKFFLSSLIQKASIHNNTGGIFKGFYKDKKTGIGKFGGTNENALNRIKGRIEIEKPILSNYECDFENFQLDANLLCKKLKKTNFDLVYIDPPYNQHPYGSNYFMLNLIIRNRFYNEISKISGIPVNWNRSNYNKKREIYSTFKNLIMNLSNSKYLIISYNSEGFLLLEDFKRILSKNWNINIEKINYNTYRASRNLYKRSIHLYEYLIIAERKI